MDQIWHKINFAGSVTGFFAFLLPALLSVQLAETLSVPLFPTNARIRGPISVLYLHPDPVRAGEDT